MNRPSCIALTLIHLALVGTLAIHHPLAGQEVRRVSPQEGSQGRRLGLGFNPQQAQPSVRMVEPGSLAEQAGFEVGDVIESVNGSSLAAYGSGLPTLFGGPEPLVFMVQRDGETLTLRVAASESGHVAPGGGEVPVQTVDPAELDAVTLELADILEEQYLFPERAARYAELLREKVRAGDYRALPDAAAFAYQVSADLNGLAEDRHLRLSPPGRSAVGPSMVRREPGAGGEGGATPETVPESGWLNDDVAFMRIGLMPPDPELKEWAARFMEEHAAAKALVLDLRMCRGGTLDMMNGFLPYLFGEETHLVTMDMRPGPPGESDGGLEEAPELRPVDNDDGVLRWNHVISPSQTANKPEMPVYVLTGFTGSACEHLTLALKVTDRATVIGSRTAGAGHFANSVELQGGYTLLLPIGRTYDPRTGLGWEIIGIEPDIEIEPGRAEAHALELFEATTGGSQEQH